MSKKNDDVVKISYLETRFVQMITELTPAEKQAAYHYISGLIAGRKSLQATCTTSPEKN